VAPDPAGAGGGWGNEDSRRMTVPGRAPGVQVVETLILKAKILYCRPVHVYGHCVVPHLARSRCWVTHKSSARVRWLQCNSCRGC